MNKASLNILSWDLSCCSDIFASDYFAQLFPWNQPSWDWELTSLVRCDLWEEFSSDDFYWNRMAYVYSLNAAADFAGFPTLYRSAFQIYILPTLQTLSASLATTGGCSRPRLLRRPDPTLTVSIDKPARLRYCICLYLSVCVSICQYLSIFVKLDQDNYKYWDGNAV